MQSCRRIAQASGLSSTTRLTRFCSSLQQTLLAFQHGPEICSSRTLMILSHAPASPTSLCQSPLPSLREQILPSVLRSPFLSVQVRGAKKQANELRRGNIIEKNSKYLQVVKATHTQGIGRASGIVQVEVRDARTGLKGQERLRPEDKVEIIIPDSVTYQYLYSEGDVVHLMHPESFEQVTIPLVVIEDVQQWLDPNIPVTVLSIDGDPLRASVPERITMEVVDADPRMAGGGRADGNMAKKCTLANGMVIEVPAFVDAGDSVIINTDTGAFMSRAKKE
mmetsp:Transcript_36270/g.43801  ORF Transcript_36270/g.43801 Transcript_36270/m.43801 type:complete len:279 (-) Transcript_36270:46-882(-)